MTHGQREALGKYVVCFPGQEAGRTKYSIAVPAEAVGRNAS